MTAGTRSIHLCIHLVGGHVHEVTLPEDAKELMTLYRALASPDTADNFVQLPLDGGKSACSLRTSQVVSIESEPPVVIELPKGAHSLSTNGSTHIRRPRFLVIDDFLSPQEHREILALALMAEKAFKAGTSVSFDPDYRQNLAITGFGSTVQSKLIQNRLLVWFPILTKTFGMTPFPLASVESQLTAAGDGQFYKVHKDSSADLPRALSCIYYVHREPRGFAGGALRLYDCIEENGVRKPAGTYTTLEPANNRMVVFPSEEFHEAMPVRCPSGEFADYRFAVTNWLHRGKLADTEASFGWGHFHCGVVPPQFADSIDARSEPL